MFPHFLRLSFIHRTVSISHPKLLLFFPICLKWNPHCPKYSLLYIQSCSCRLLCLTILQNGLNPNDLQWRCQFQEVVYLLGALPLAGFSSDVLFLYTYIYYLMRIHNFIFWTRHLFLKLISAHIYWGYTYWGN